MPPSVNIKARTLVILLMQIALFGITRKDRSTFSGVKPAYTAFRALFGGNCPSHAWTGHQIMVIWQYASP